MCDRIAGGLRVHLWRVYCNSSSGASWSIPWYFGLRGKIVIHVNKNSDYSLSISHQTETYAQFYINQWL